MKYNPEVHHRRSVRLKEYDYSQAGAYFVTICTKDRISAFGRIVGEQLNLSPLGEVAKRCCVEIPGHFLHVKLDEYVIMPNHVHGIIIIQSNTVGVRHVEPLQNEFQRIIAGSVGSIVRSYKAAVTRRCHRMGQTNFRWQRNYYERVIRNEKSLNRIRQYIINNPIQWSFDEENPDAISAKSTYLVRSTL